MRCLCGKSCGLRITSLSSETPLAEICTSLDILSALFFELRSSHYGCEPRTENPFRAMLIVM